MFARADEAFQGQVQLVASINGREKSKVIYGSGNNYYYDRAERYVASSGFVGASSECLMRLLRI